MEKNRDMGSEKYISTIYFGMFLSTLVSHKLSICYQNSDDNRALPSSEIQVK